MNNHRVIPGEGYSARQVLAEEFQRYEPCQLLGLWRSPLVRAIRTHGPESGLGITWLQFLDRVVKHGVSSDEIAFSRIRDWLEWANRDISRREVLDYLDEFGLKIHVLQPRAFTCGRPWLMVEDPHWPTRFHSGTRHDDLGRFGFQLEPAGLFDPPDSLPWVVHYRPPESTGVAKMLQSNHAPTASLAARASAWEFANIGPGPIGHYPLAALGGGDNYRELLFVVPDAFPPFRQDHFPNVTNVLAHLRLSDQVLDSGERVVHIEEIQSDWHNPRYGHDDPLLKKQWRRIVLSWCIQEALERGLDGVSLTDGKLHRERAGQHTADGLERFYHGVEKALRREAARAGGKPATVTFTAMEQRFCIHSGDEGIAILSREGAVIQSGFENIRDARCVLKAIQPPRPMDFPGVLLDPHSDEAAQWTRPFHCLDERAHVVAKGDGLTEQGRRLLELVDDLQEELFVAYELLVLECFKKLADCAGGLRRLMERHDVLPESARAGLEAAFDALVEAKDLYGRRRTNLAADALVDIRRRLAALRRSVKQTGGLAEDWHHAAPGKLKLEKITLGDRTWRPHEE